MNYAETLEALNAGLSVRRSRWMQESIIRVFHGLCGLGPYVEYPLNPFTGRSNPGSQLPYIFSEEDVAATDWYVVQ